MSTRPTTAGFAPEVTALQMVETCLIAHARTCHDRTQLIAALAPWAAQSGVESQLDDLVAHLENRGALVYGGNRRKRFDDDEPTREHPPRDDHSRPRRPRRAPQRESLW